APAAAPGASRFPGSVVIAVGTGPAARRANATLGDGRFSFQSSWMQEDGDRMLELSGDAATGADGSTELDYSLKYSIKPTEGRMLIVTAKGKVNIPSQGAVELKATSDGPVTLSAFKDVP
ncbi:MAG: hypothetical protein Q8T11_13760, partial [Elusimicrobiota bacterium]|nr:hypothetical protein [Elusimicrobiota bacterium]